jgi:DUF971 family protein
MKVKSIRQIDNHSFQIEWSDGVQQEFLLHTLQKNCPCAACVDEFTGQRLPARLDPHVKALRIKSIGRYALKVAFTSGCSTGIFHFEDLRKLGKPHD